MKQTQCDRIIQYMGETGSITAWEAIKELGVLRLAARIADLKRDGHKIITTTEKGKNRYGDPCRWARYRMAQDE